MPVEQNICSKCGTPSVAGNLFCGKCGASLSPSGEASPATSLPYKRDQRAHAMGILNIIFSIIYLGCTGVGIVVVPSMIETARQVLQSDVVVLESIIVIAVNGFTFLGLLISGILLLQGRATGRSLTHVTAVVVVGFVVLDFFFVASLSQRIASQALPFSCFGTAMRAVYPVVSALVLSSPPQQLGLK